MTPLELEIWVDSFAGGGGASKGMEMARGRGPDIGINHDAEAIALHKANHPETQHYTEDVWRVDPVKACRGRPVGLMWLSPDCKHFSKAKGGKPVSPRVRGLAWVAVRWAEAVQPRIIVLENVEEFQTWGPVVRATGLPCQARRGQTFRAFVGKLRKLGYVVEWRELRACDYGAPTIRKRLFLVARCDGQPIVWPVPTHGKGRALPWRTAAECIDFALPCPSIFARRKPLAENTLKRIGAGLRRFVFEADRPFIVGVGGRMGQSPPRSVEQPYQTITAKADAAIVMPTLVHFKSDAPASVDAPLPTQTGKDCFGLVAPHLVEYHGQKHEGDDRTADLAAPLPVQDTSNRFGLVAPLLVPRYGENPAGRGGLGQEPRARPVDKPMASIVPTQNGASLVAAFLAKHYGDRGQRPGLPLFEPLSTVTAYDHHSLVTAHIKRDFGQSVGHAADAPMGTVTPDGGGHCALVTSSLVNLRGTEPSHLHGDSLDSPMRTVSAGGLHAAEVRAFLVTYYGTDQKTGNLFDPMVTVTPKDRLGLVMVEGVEYQLADIGMRMLAPRELYRAQGFPDSYKIDIEFNGKPMSKTAQVRMCGNSVCPDVAAAIIRANVRRSTAEEQAA